MSVMVGIRLWAVKGNGMCGAVLEKQKATGNRGLNQLLNLSGLLGCYWLHRGITPTIAVVGELHATGNLCEERIVGSDADIGAGLDLGAALANDDRSARHELPRKGLYAQTLRIGITSICGAASTLLMCHFLDPFFVASRQRSAASYQTSVFVLWPVRLLSGKAERTGGKLLLCRVGHTVGFDRLDANFGEILAMSLHLLVLLLPL